MNGIEAIQEGIAVDQIARQMAVEVVIEAHKAEYERAVADAKKRVMQWKEDLMMLKLATRNAVYGKTKMSTGAANA